MRKASIVAFVLLLLAIGCGSEGEKGDLAADGTSAPKARATASPDSKPGDNGDDGDGDAGTGTTDDGDTQASSAPVESAEPGTFNKPKSGTYVYDLDGKASDPLNPAAPPQEYSEDAEATAKISHKGDIQTSEISNTESPGVTTVRTRRESSRIALLSIKIEQPTATFNCVFEPPITIAKFPPKAGSFGAQSWKCKGEEATGKTTISVVGQETVKDAKDKSWSTWKVHVVTETNSEQFDLKQDEMRWVSPDLGVEVRSDGDTNGSFKTQAGTSQKFTSETQTALKQRP